VTSIEQSSSYKQRKEQDLELAKLRAERLQREAAARKRANEE